MTEPWGAPRPEFASNATQTETETADLNEDGRLTKRSNALGGPVAISGRPKWT